MELDLKPLQDLQSEYHWSIGSTVTGDFTCSIWERKRWRDRNRIVINGSGKDFPEAIANALRGLAERGDALRTYATQCYKG